MLYVVTGAPAAGKSTWVTAHAKPGDLRFDTDALTNVITGRTPGKHHHDTKSKTVTQAVRQAGIDAALPMAGDRDIYVIHSNLSPELEARYRARGAQFVIVDPGEEENIRRCSAHRPGYKLRQVRDWYARRATWPRGALIVSGREPVNPQADEHTVTDSQSTPRDMSSVHVVIGPPAAGKSTFVREHAGPDDVVIDFDLLANALSNQEVTNHDHTKTVKMVTKTARAAAVAKACSMGVTTWMIHSSPAQSTLNRYAAAGATIHVVDPGKDVVMSRCKRERPRAMMIAAAKWYDEHKPRTKKNFRERGYSYHNHDLPRKRLLMALKDGSPCWWCGLPMHKDKRRNWDGNPLAADHSNAHGAKNGEQPDRLLHGRCNSQRQDGRYDDRRPALTGKRPSEPLAPQAGAQALQRGQQDGDAAAFVWK